MFYKKTYMIEKPAPYNAKIPNPHLVVVAAYNLRDLPST
jgi:hypothetical protein